MSSFQRLVFLMLSDIIAINLASIVFLWIKFTGGALDAVTRYWYRRYPDSEVLPDFWFSLSYYLDALLLICVFWVVFLFIFGHFRLSPSQSRFDEIFDIVKVLTLGVLLFFVATFDQGDIRLTRLLIFFYWLALIVFIASGRIIVHSFERQLFLRGIGRRKTLIVGTNARGERLFNDLDTIPDREFELVGFTRAKGDTETSEVRGLPVLGNVEDLSVLIREHNIDIVLIALQSNSHQEVMDIVAAAEGEVVSFRITPDLYDIVTGHVRTMQIYGVPLMELKPELMPAWESYTKRLFDIVFSLVILSLLSPLWVLIAFVIKLTSDGPILFRQERVGQNGVTFTMYKFRSMRLDAESETGPIWVRGEDPRVTLIGRLLRTLHLDEIPQCINFLRGDMSLVGPRPERPFFVEKFREEIPLYSRRFNVKPGLLGWAQAKHEFDMDSDDITGIVRERLEYDLYYIENMSLKLDMKIIFQTIWFVLAGKSTR